MGRIHTYEQFLDTYNLARKVGFGNINVDLMLGLPNQKLEDLKESVERVIDLVPQHISIYSLIVEEGTALEKQIQDGIYKLPAEELERKMYWHVKNVLQEKGYVHYEISNFAKNGYESKHNLDCWNQKEYLGFGLSAHSYFNKIRYSNTECLEKYIEMYFNNMPFTRDNKILNEYQDMERKLMIGKTIHEHQDKEAQMNEYMILRAKKNRRSIN